MKGQIGILIEILMRRGKPKGILPQILKDLYRLNKDDEQKQNKLS